MPQYEATNSRCPSILVFAVIVGLILYGSLYPFEFYTCLDPVGGLLDLLAIWKQPSSLGDVLANVLFCLPVGLLAAKASPGMASPLRVITAVVAGAGLSVSVEFAQLYDVGRVSAMLDVYANSLGTLLGAGAGTASSTDFTLRLWQDLRHRQFAALLLRCWLAYRLFPYVPVIDAHKYWQAIRPLLEGPSPSFGDLLRDFASWLGVGALLESVWGPPARNFVGQLIGNI
jgi:VanZ family protein